MATTELSSPDLDTIIEFFSSPLVFFLAMLILVFIGIIHPYRKKAKEREKFLRELKVGQLVVTNGGIIGQVTKVEEEYVWLEIAPKVEVLLVKDYIIGICNPS